MVYLFYCWIFIALVAWPDEVAGNIILIAMCLYEMFYLVTQVMSCVVRGSSIWRITKLRHDYFVYYKY
jgi:hypothetical protein